MATSTAAGQTTQDRDGDRVVDADDLCADVAETVNGVDDEDGCPDADRDRDGVSDAYDACPELAETVNDFEDADGCPDTERVELRRLAERVFFATGRSEISPAADGAIGEVAAYLIARPRGCGCETSRTTSVTG